MSAGNISNATGRKLTDDQVLEIRRRYVRGEGGYKKLSKDYRVHSTTIRRIVRRQTSGW